LVEAVGAGQSFWIKGAAPQSRKDRKDDGEIKQLGSGMVARGVGQRPADFRWDTPHRE
jgi:hypothetical protein